MAGKYGSSSFSVWLVGGYNLLAAKVQAFSYELGIDVKRSDGLGDSWNEFSPTGMRVAQIGQEGAFFDDSTANIHDAMSSPTANAVARVACFAAGGNAVGQPFVGLYGVVTTGYSVIAKLGDLTLADAKYEVTGQADEGVILQPHAQKSADWNTDTDGTGSVDYVNDPSQRVVPITSNSQANPTVVTCPVAHGLTTGDKIFVSGSNSTPSINGEQTVTVTGTLTFTLAVNVTVAGNAGTFVRSNSSSGGAAYLQVSEFTGLTGFVGKVQHSHDDITYADLATFANVTSAPAYERVAVAGTVRRHLAFDGNVTGTGTITSFCGFSRYDPS